MKRRRKEKKTKKKLKKRLFREKKKKRQAKSNNLQGRIKCNYKKKFVFFTRLCGAFLYGKPI